MIKKHNCIIIDTETINGFEFPIVHDIAYRVVDKDYNVKAEYRALVEEFHRYGHDMLMSSNFYVGKDTLYQRAIAEGTVDIKPYGQIIADMLADIKRYKVTCICAYNLNFDRNAILKTAKFFNIDCKNELYKTWDKMSELCIWNLACKTILNTADYKAFAQNNEGIKKDSGNYRTDAEICYRYITQNTEYSEEHTALQDVIDETYILKHITDNVKGRAIYGRDTNCWRAVQC